MKNPIKNMTLRLKAFSKSMSGTVSVEAMIMLPILLWLIAAMAVFLDVFRTKSAMDKAAFTISDALSRETNAITDDYITNTRVLFEELANLEDGSGSLRLTVIEWDINNDRYAVEWSQTRGDAFNPLDTANLSQITTFLPDISLDETLILVETHYRYEPLYDIGPIMSGRNDEGVAEANAEASALGSELQDAYAWDLDFGTSDMQTFVFTRPRYSSQLVYESG
ncbi:MAG: hypothetical protein VX444_08150 [Pseudomonadota bacterium]|nr:hypothetical protein [Pseudomonadota bacterium]